MANIVSRTLGAVVGAILGTITAIMVFNPLAVIYQLAGAFEEEPTRKNFSLILISPLIAIFFLLYNGLITLSLTGLLAGADKGLKKALEFPGEVLKDKNRPIFIRNMLAGWIVSGLIAGAVLCVIFPPASIAIYLPTLVAMLGLSSLSIGLLAAMAGIIVGVLASLLCALTLTTYDLCTMSAPHSELPAPSQTIKPAESAAGIIPPLRNKQPPELKEQEAENLTAPFFLSRPLVDGAAQDNSYSPRNFTSITNTYKKT